MPLLPARLARFAMPLGCTALLIFGCSQDAGAEQATAGRTARASAPAAAPPPDLQRGEATQPGIPDGSEAAGSTPATCVSGDSSPAPCTMAPGRPDAGANTVVAFKLDTPPAMSATARR